MNGFQLVGGGDPQLLPVEDHLMTVTLMEQLSILDSSNGAGK